MIHKPRVIILGKLPPPHFGTSVWFETLRRSSLTNHYSIQWFNVNIHTDLSTLGKSSLKGILKNIRLYVKFRKVLKEFDPQLVLIPVSQSTKGFLKDSVFIRMAARTARTLIILHGSNILNWFNTAPVIIKKYFSATIKKTSGVIVLGANLKYLFRKWFADNKIFVVPNGVDADMEDIQHSKRKELIIRYIGTLIRAKGIIELIQAAEILKAEGFIFQVRINGECPDPSLEREIERTISRNNLPVFLEGVVTGERKKTALRESDIFIFTPVKPEGHPLVIIEAMAAALPVISTDQGAITESVKDGINGFIVEAGDAVQIAQKAACLISDPGLRIKMGKAGRSLYEKYYTAEAMAERFHRVFTEVNETVHR